MTDQSLLSDVDWTFGCMDVSLRAIGISVEGGAMNLNSFFCLIADQPRKLAMCSNTVRHKIGLDDQQQ